MEVDIKSLVAVHGEHEINKMQVGQLCIFQQELIKGKGKGSSQENPTSSSGSLGIKTNPLKNPKNVSGEEKIRGHKPR
jgi:hypothetical protein